MVQIAGIEPTLLTPKASVKPLNYIHILVGDVGLEPTMSEDDGFTVRLLTISSNHPWLGIRLDSN